MSRDDYISKLFIKNEDKLTQAPSDDLWSRLEATLDEQLPVAETAAPPPKILSLSRYFAAASVLIAVVGSVYLFDMAKVAKDQNMAVEIVLEPEPIALLEDEPEPYEDAEIMPTGDVIAAAEEEVRVQEEKIVEAVKEKVLEEKIAVANKPSNNIEIGDIKIIDDSEEDDGASVILIEPEPAIESQVTNTVTANLNSNPGIYQYNSTNEVTTKEAIQQNYANAVPQIGFSATNNNSSYADKVVKKSEANKKGGRQKPKAFGSRSGVSKTASRARGNKRGIVSNKSKKVKRYRSPMATAHARLHPFGFLLGTWTDVNEDGGKSYETWSLKDAHTLTGKGYKLSKDNDRIFEEMMRIEFKNNQVFLVISLDENRTTVNYMLSKFDTERFIFTQSESSKYPDKVVFQRNLNGYSVIISSNKDFLTAEQQRYLENRNRVSHLHAKRTMSDEN